MSDTLVLIGGDAPDAPMAWVRTDGARIGARGMVDETPPPATAPVRTVLVLPGADARLVHLELPARSDAQARAGAEMLVAGALAAGEKTHYAVGPQQNAQGERLVAAIAATRLQRWLERCVGFGADPGAVLLDCAVWPAADGEVVIAAAPNRVILTAGRRGGFSIEPALAPALAAQWLAGAGAAGRVTLLGGEPELYHRALKREMAHAPLPDPVATLAVAAAAGSSYAPNLRQGQFAIAGAEQRPFALWRFAALLLVAAVLLQSGALATAGWRDHQAARQIMARAEQDFRAARPDVGRVVNLRGQAAALVNAMEQAAHHPLIVTSDPVVRALQQHPLARLDEVRHEGATRRVRLVLSAPQPAALEAAIGAIREQGLTLEARTLQPREGRYVSELLVEAP
jgi:type II secretion system protein L